MINLSQNKKDIGMREKLYKLLKTRVHVALEPIRARKSFEEILELNRMKEPIDIDNPKTFDDKIWYIKKHFYSPLAVKCADKAAVREYVKECGLEEILVPVYGIFDSPYEIDFSKLPDECYIKCNHTSGSNWLYRRGMTDERWLKKLFALYLKRNHYNVSKEWVYREIPPKIIVEKKLENADGQSLRDYRFFCFDGEVKVVLIHVGTATERGEHAKTVTRSFYTPEFQWIPELTIKGNAKAPAPLEKPQNYDRMVDIAQRLSKPFAFCRVDLYNIGGSIYLSELTFLPNAGINHISPMEWDLKMGEWLDLEKCKNNPVYEYQKQGVLRTES